MTNQRQTQADNAVHSRSHARLRFAAHARVGWLLGIVALAPLGMGARGCEQAVVGADCSEDGKGDKPACVCEYDGKHYAAGDSFKATDDCNQCTCQKDGEVACGLLGCETHVDAGTGTGGNGDGSGKTCGGLIGAGCDADEYCNFPPSAQCGAADQTGTCASKPQICTAIYAPVCGCDDKTYSSDCVAASHGISVASKGECKADTDGGTPADGCDYDGEHYDEGDSFPATDGCNTCNCGANGSVGCTKIGCDPGGATCGGLIGATCAKDQYCHFAPDALCGAADATGICEALPQVCDDIYKPVCGCDGMTYSNDCEAGAKGQSVASEGECGKGPDTCTDGDKQFKPGQSFAAPDGCNQCTCNEDGTSQCTLIGCDPGATCGGIAGIQCPGKQYCDFAPATMCGSGDQSGTCKDRPDACTDVIAPVCGCDGNDYSSACFAQVAGVSVLHSGECE